MRNIKYINASAGTGKTYRLTHLLPDYLTGSNGKAKIKPSQIIVTTFTKAAAAEIKERARKVLIEKNQIEEAANLETSAIGTIHAVAQMFINKYWYRLDISPDCDVISEEDANIYTNSSMNDLLTEQDYDFFKEAFTDFGYEKKKSDSYGKQANPTFWKDYIAEIVKKIAYYNIDIKVSQEESKKAADQLFPNAKPRTDYKTIKEEYIEEIEKKEAKAKTDADNINAIKILSNEATYTNVKTLFEKANKLSFGKKNDDKNKKANYIDQITEILERANYAGKLNQITERLLELAKKWKENYAAYKKNNQLIDYDDMEIMFKKLLTEEEYKDIQDEIRAQYMLVMVDEFQDCNPIQLDIFKRLAELLPGGEHIWVGDPKQAIYGFRGTDAELTTEVLKQYGNSIATEVLDTNYRSRKELVELSREVFDSNDMPGLKGLKAHRGTGIKTPTDLGAPYQNWHMQTTNKKTFAKILAQKINRILNVEKPKIAIETEKGGKKEETSKEIAYKDIAILARNNSDVNQIAEALRSYGIPVSAPEADFFMRTEIQLVFAILDYASHKTAAHSKASIYKLLADKTTQDIFRSRKDLITKTSKKEGEDAKEESAKWLSNEDAIKQVEVIAERLKNISSINEKVSAIILELSLYDMVKKWDDTEARRQNLSSLISVADKYVERCTRLKLPATERDFINYVQHAELEDPKIKDTDTVKVYTYHASKGLEWPMVVLTSLTYNPLDKVSYTGIHKLKKGDTEYLQIIPVDNLADNVTEDIKSNRVYIDATEKERKEAKRLMYVGMTRARDYLITTTYGEYAKLKKGEDPSKPRPLKINKPTWLESIFGEYGDEKLTIKTGTDPDKGEINIWGQKGITCKIIKEETSTPNGISDKTELRRMPSMLNRATYEDMILSPSLAKPTDCDIDWEVKQEKVEIATIESEVINSTTGTCIHNILASLGPDTKYSDVEESLREITNSYGVKTDTGQIVKANNEFYDYLKTNYTGNGVIDHEHPFMHKLSDGRIARGEIDLLWHISDKEVVLVDFKNVKEAEGGHLKSAYSAQMAVYKQALEEAGYTVKSILIYCPLQGKVFSFKQ